ncbi:hypothetical protein IFM89_020014 [Coptis chinensis]|uniref:Uncharacterized protein n=1 Tax=Coptis chinensis TaxID=261450 RepID=A0A835M6T2_9MAGN|nr:hypothetical protein IFM89_020014 [Coptis chinensis]
MRLFSAMKMGNKRWFSKKINKESWPWSRKLFTKHRFGWKRIEFQSKFLDSVLFRIISVLEAIALVAVLCFFFCCCGGHL